MWGVVKKRGSPEFSSTEVGISVRIEPSCINFYQLCFASDQGLLWSLMGYLHFRMLQQLILFWHSSEPALSAVLLLKLEVVFMPTAGLYFLTITKNKIHIINFMNRIRSGIITGNVTFWKSITFMLLIHGDYQLALLADLISSQNIEFCIEHFSFQKW